MGRVIGIDLGTTNSCVAIMDGGEPRITSYNVCYTKLLRWEFGHYSAGTTFTPNLATNSFYSNWIGGDGRLWTRSGGTPEVGQYAQNTHATYPSVRRWTSSYAGRVAIEYDARRLRYEGDGVDVEIRHNGALLMTHTLNHNVSTSYNFV